MISIQTTSNDHSTIDVLDWLFYYNVKDVIRINDVVTINKITYEIENGKDTALSLNGIDFSDIVSHWYRRGWFRFFFPSLTKSDLGCHIRPYLDKEMMSILDIIDSFFSNKKGAINKYGDNGVNKINNLNCAMNAGLKIPDTIITNDITRLTKFVLKYNQVITKPLRHPTTSFEYSDTTVNINSIVEAIGTGNLKAGNLPALYQQYIQKKFELRIFYLKGQFFPMAIFSQQNERTKIDFRNYDNDRPNRCVPYVLPPHIEQKLKAFMYEIDINCGSIDMIYTPEGEYIFLEVNPVGQYQWLEQNCNYPISKLIAEDLINGQ